MAENEAASVALESSADVITVSDTDIGQQKPHIDEEEVVIIDNPVPNAKKRKPNPTPAATQECSICFEELRSSGRHRIVSLSCGHLFGKNCIERWIKEKKVCPQCNTRVKKNDIRPLFVSAIQVLDSSKYDHVTQELAKQTALQKQKSSELTKCQLQCQKLQMKCTKQQQELETLRQKLAQTREQLLRYENNPAMSPLQHLRAPDYQYDQFQAISVDAARVFAFSLDAENVYVGKRTHGTNSFGFAKCSLLDPVFSKDISVHLQPLRDIKLSTTLALTISTDKMVKVTSLATDTTVIQYQLPRPGWCCEFYPQDPLHIFAGTIGGSVYKFDLRQTREFVHVYQSTNTQPIHSILLTKSVGDPNYSLVAGDMKGMTMWSNLEDPSESIVVPFPFSPGGSCVSLSQNPTADIPQFLASSRGNSEHLVFSLDKMTAGGYQCNIQKKIAGHKAPSALSRSSIWNSRDGMTVVASADEKSRSVALWDADATCDSIPSYVGIDCHRTSIVDVQHVVRQNTWGDDPCAVLGTLSTDKLCLYKHKRRGPMP